MQFYWDFLSCNNVVRSPKIDPSDGGTLPKVQSKEQSPITLNSRQIDLNTGATGVVCALCLFKKSKMILKEK